MTGSDPGRWGPPIAPADSDGAVDSAPVVLPAPLADCPPTARAVYPVVATARRPLSSREVAARAATPRRSATAALGDLEAAGLVERRANARAPGRPLYVALDVPSTPGD